MRYFGIINFSGWIVLCPKFEIMYNLQSIQICSFIKNCVTDVIVVTVFKMSFNCSKANIFMSPYDTGKKVC